MTAPAGRRSRFGERGEELAHGGFVCVTLRSPAPQDVVGSGAHDVSQVGGRERRSEEVERTRLNRLNVEPRVHPAGHHDDVYGLGRVRRQSQHVSPQAVSHRCVCENQMGRIRAAQDSPRLFAIPRLRCVYPLAFERQSQAPQRLGRLMNQ